MTDQNPQTGEILDDGSMTERDRLSAQLSSLWWTFLIRGVLAGAVGIAALFWPSGSIALLLRLVGALLIIDGGLTLLGGWSSRAVGRGGHRRCSYRPGPAYLAGRHRQAGLLPAGRLGIDHWHRLTGRFTTNE